MEYKSRKKQYIGHEGFMKTTIKKVVINGTVYLDSHVFYQCQNLETVVLNGTITNKFPENLALVDGLELDGTFSGCVNLTQFKLGNNRGHCTALGHNCRRLESLCL